jgi:hypothetical protein
VNDLQHGGVQKQVADRAKITANLWYIDKSDKAIRRRHLKDFQNRGVSPFTDELGIKGKARVCGKRGAQALREVGQSSRIGDIQR